MTISKRAENITEEIYLEYKKKYSFCKPGLKVFYSPIVARPRLVIISYQPGGTGKNFQKRIKNLLKKGILDCRNSIHIAKRVI